MLNYYNPSTASKNPERFPDNYPKEIIKGKGAYIYDNKGNKYFDFCCSLGPIILGHRFPDVDDMVVKTIRDEGNIFSLSHPKEKELANLLCDMLDSEMVRFGHNGKDVTEAAVRLARHITGRELVLSFSYHGAADVFMACTKADKGVPLSLKLSIAEFDYNDIETVRKFFDKNEVAAIILEPHTIRMPENRFLEELRELCTNYGALLIFDEVVSFPRYIGYSAQSYFKINPDLTCVSKGISNGYPISALVGKEKYMKELKDEGVFFSTTFGGNLIGVSAALATLNFIRENRVPEYLDCLGGALKIKDNPHVKLVGLPCRQFLECSDMDRQKIWQEMIKKGYFFHVPIFFNYSMNISEMNRISRELDNVIESLDNIKIEGRITNELFKKI